MIELGQKSKPQKTPEPKINNDNREVHDSAEVVAERPEVSSPSQFDASHMLVSGGKLRRPFIVDAFENVQTDLGTLPPPLSPAPSYTSLWTPMSPVQAHPHRCPVSRHDTAFERAKSVNHVSCK